MAKDMEETSIKDLSLTSSALSRTFLTPSLLFFKEAEEPLQVDEWLNIIEQKFRLLRLTEHLKTEYASH